jgi:cation diffusion facilitator family transporter
LLTVFWINVCLSCAKLWLGFLTATLSLVAEGFHSLLDSSANAVAVLGLTVSMKPPDENHPYGHRKFEALSAIAISFFMFLASFEVLQEIVHRLMSSEKHEAAPNLVCFLVVVINLIANFAISSWEKRQSQALKSNLLMADARHTMSDVWSTVAVLVALFAVHFKLHFVDIISSVLIVGIILHAGYEVIMSHLGPLTDSAMLDPASIEKVVNSVPGVMGCHKIRSRGMEDHIFVDLHVQVDKSITIESAHSISFSVEKAIKEFDDRVYEILVHLEDDNPPVANPPLGS